jgi:presenilin-like A22 family membrane protease
MKLKLFKSNAVYWSILVFVLAQLLTFFVITRENSFLESNQIYVPPQPTQAVTLWPEPTVDSSGNVTQTPLFSSLGPILIYFFAVVLVMGVVLFLIPVKALKIVLRAIFAFLFGWSMFIILIFWIPWPVTLVLAAGVALAWLIAPRVWLHNLVMTASMVALASVFGRVISPWTAMILLAALAVYDFLAVRFGYMIWMAGKLSDSNTLPAFVFPRSTGEWKSRLNQTGFTGMVEKESSEREYSILGGGDIGFSLLIVSSFYFAHGFANAVYLSVFSLLGLIGAYVIQATLLKGKPMPALPPIAFFCLIGFLLIR